MMPTFSDSREFWRTPLPDRPEMTARDLMDHGIGDPEYDFDTYVSGAYGEKVAEYFKTFALYNGRDDHPDVLAYWRHYGKGLEKTVHRHPDPFRCWSAYVPCSYQMPENSDRKYPCIIIGQRTTTMMQYEAGSFIHMAAREELIVLTGNDVNEDDYFENILDSALKLYPIDPSRVYLHGHSFGAVLSGRHAVKYAGRIAGVCMSGSQYYGADSTAAEIDTAKKLRMPLIAVHCTRQSRNLLPYNVTPRHRMSPKNRMNATTSDFTLLTGYEEIRFWRMINHCPPASFEYMRDIQKLSDDACEKVLGIAFDDTHVEKRDLVNHYFGDIRDDQGTVMMRYVAVEGGPHAVPPHAGDIAWEYLRHFSRDLITGALVRQGDAVGHPDPYWTTAFPAADYLTPCEWVGLQGDSQFDFDAHFGSELTAQMKRALRPSLQGFENDEARRLWWESLGIVRREYRTLDKEWVLFRPKDHGEPMPLVIYLGDDAERFEGEAAAMVLQAARLGMMTVAVRDVNNDGLVDGVLALLEEKNLLQKNSVMLAGFGFGAPCAGRHGIRLAHKITAVALMGDQYYGYDNTHEQVAAAADVELPVVMIHGTREARGILPLYENSPLPLPSKRADNVTVSTFSLISSYSEHLFWRQKNNCAPVSLQDMAQTQFDRDECVRAIGAPMDRTWTETLYGVRLLAGDVLTPAGRTAIRYIAMEGAPHYASPVAMNRALRFFAEKLGQ